MDSNNKYSIFEDQDNQGNDRYLVLKKKSNGYFEKVWTFRDKKEAEEFAEKLNKNESEG